MSAPPNIIGQPTLTATLANVNQQTSQGSLNNAQPGTITQFVPVTETIVPADSAAVTSAAGATVTVSDSVSPSDSDATATGPGTYDFGIPEVYDAGAYDQ